MRDERRDLAEAVRRRFESLCEKLRPPLVLRRVLLEVGRTPGRLFRPRLICSAYRACAGRRAGSRVQAVAAAYEVFHTAVLIHDDLVDGARFRRGRGATHEVLGGGRRGWSGALLAGDLLLVEGLGGVAAAAGPSPRGAAVMGEVVAGALRTGVGALRAWARSAGPPRPRSAPLQASACLDESGWYSVVVPLRLGARLAGWDDARTVSWDRVGEPAGKAFQLLDDCSDLVDASGGAGDLYRGGGGAVVAAALRRLSPPDRTDLEGLLRVERPSATERRRMLALVLGSGAMTAVAAQARRLLGRARRALAGLDGVGAGRADVAAILDGLEGEGR